MKNNKFLLAILVVLVAVASYYFLNDKSGTLGFKSGVNSDFAFEDTTQIDKIFISNPKGENVTLIKGEKYWTVNGKHKARPESISVLMNTFNRIAVKSPVSKNALPNVIKSMATRAIKVEVYEGSDDPSKIYYVGEPTQNHQGTYMLLETDGEKSTEPFVMYIPGFYGYLTTRFYSNPEQWRDAAIFKYTPMEIQNIVVDYPLDLERSFTISKKEDIVSLFDNVSNQKIENANQELLNEYLNFYGRVYYEEVATEMAESKKDSIINAQPYFSIKVTDVFGNENKIKGYRIPNNDSIPYADGNIYPYDLDRMYGYYNDELVVFIQYRTFDALLLPKQYFLN